MATNLVDSIINRVAKAIAAGNQTIDSGLDEAYRDIKDLFNGKPHGYDFSRVKREVLAKIGEDDEE